MYLNLAGPASMLTKFSQHTTAVAYGCYNSKLRSRLLNDSTKKYCSTPLSNRVEMEQDPQIYELQQENFKKMLHKY